MHWSDVVRLMVVAYKDATGARNMRYLLDGARDGWPLAVRRVAGMLLDEDVAPAAYVEFACAAIREKRGRDPWPAEVFSVKSAEGWLKGWRRESTEWAPVPVYATTVERRADYARRLAAMDRRRGGSADPSTTRAA